MPEIEEEQEGQSTRPFWSGTITFGLVSIPVSIFPANRQSRVSLRMLDPKGTPLARRYYSPESGKELSPDEMVRGYEAEKSQYVIVSDEELEQLTPEKSRDIDLRKFVGENEIPPLYFERAYFLVPATGSTKAYRLLAATMEESKRAGIATFVMRGKEYLVAILSENGILRAETLRFADEVRSPEDVGLPQAPEISEKQVRPFSEAIRELAQKDLPRSGMQDRKAEQLLSIARKKQKQQEGVFRGEASGKVIDILSVLQKSLQQASEKRKASPSENAGKNEPSRNELYEKAKKRNIPGRSSMSRDELIKALAAS